MERNVCVFQGANGAGKSNLLNSITWCFYGVEEHLEKYEGSRQAIASDGVLHSLKGNEKAHVYVEIRLTSEEGRVNIFRRDAWFKKDRIEPVKMEFQGWVKTSQKLVPVTEPNFMVERILPQRISSFFFFDGERLDDFFRSDIFSLIKDAVYEVSHLSLLESAIHRLNETIRKIRDSVKRLTPQIADIEGKIEATDGGIKLLREDQARKKAELDSIREEKKKISGRISASPDEEIRSLKQQRSRSKRNMERFEGIADRTKEKLADLLIQDGPFTLLTSPIQTALDLILTKTKKGELPPRVKRPFVEELLERGTCICDRDLSDSSRDAVKRLLEEVRMSEIAQDLTEMKFHLQDALRRIKRLPSETETMRESISKYTDAREEERTTLREIDTQLQKVDSAEISDAAFRLSQLESKETDILKSLGIIESKLEKADALLKSYNRDLRKALAESERHDRESRKLEVAMEMLEVLQDAHDKIIDKTRRKVEALTKKYFLSLIWKKETYVDVIVSDEYRISVINSYGDDCLGTLSAGEREVLALSFLAAIREISGFEAPIVIDTPLAKISKEPKENIARLLPEFFRNTQVTLLVTEEEYTESVRRNLLPNIGEQYFLSYIDSEHRTEVRSANA